MLLKDELWPCKLTWRTDFIPVLKCKHRDFTHLTGSRSRARGGSSTPYVCVCECVCVWWSEEKRPSSRLLQIPLWLTQVEVKVLPITWASRRGLEMKEVHPDSTGVQFLTHSVNPKLDTLTQGLGSWLPQFTSSIWNNQAAWKHARLWFSKSSNAAHRFLIRSKHLHYF